MAIKTRAPIFEIDQRELSSETLDEALERMDHDDFLLVHESGTGYRALDRREAKGLREFCSRQGAGEVRLADSGGADPLVHGELSRGELVAEFDRLQPPRRRIIQVGRDGLQIVHEPTLKGASGGAPAFNVAIDVDLFVPPGEELPNQSEALGVCVPLVPASRPPGQPFLERQHDFKAVPGSASRLCAKCGAECAHPAEQRLPGGRCGRCGAEP